MNHLNDFFKPLIMSLKSTYICLILNFGYNMNKTKKVNQIYGKVFSISIALGNNMLFSK
jgi:hypothetical protein